VAEEGEVEVVARAIAEALVLLPEPASDRRLFMTLSGSRNGTYDCGAMARAAIEALDRHREKAG
jgi:hypothetical protein